MAETVSRIYSNFRGADFRGEEINLVRSPDCLNVWHDYKETDSIRTRPGLNTVINCIDHVYGIFEYDGHLIVHSGNRLLLVANGTAKELYRDLAAAPSQAFVHEKRLYIKARGNYLCYDGTAVTSVEGYVPTTSIGRIPEGGGTTLEGVNMLSAYRINTFLSDGNATTYYLDAKNIDTLYTPVVTVDGVDVTNFTVDYALGKITFDTPPSMPLTDGADNVSVKFRKTVAGYAEAIYNCDCVQPFDNRVFFSGNDDYPGVVWHSSLNDPTYISDLDYYRDGFDDAKIRGIVAGNNALWVFREPSDANTTVFYHTPSQDYEYGKVYPSVHSSVTIGCVGRAINFNDDIVFFSKRGMEGISGDITTEQMASHRSTLIDKKLVAEKDYKYMTLVEWEGYLLCFIDNKVYLADSRAMFTNDTHVEYEWFYWELECSVTCAKVCDDVLYVGTDEGVYSFTDTKADVYSYWVTPKDKFKNPYLQKSTNKRGCVIEATGDFSVYAKTEKTDFELIGEYTGVMDCVVCRIKRKKWKDIQLKFCSTTRFCLESATLECFIGGYIKR